MSLVVVSDSLMIDEPIDERLWLALDLNNLFWLSAAGFQERIIEVMKKRTTLTQKYIHSLPGYLKVLDKARSIVPVHAGTYILYGARNA